MHLQFTPFPILQTPRLLLRALRREDALEMLMLRSDPIVLQHLPISPAENLQDALHFIEKIKAGIARNEWIMWGICQGEGEPLMGTLCFWNIDKEQQSGEIGYVLLPQYHRQGMMSEALAAALVYAFDTIAFKRIDALLTPKNINSIGLLKKFDFLLDPSFQEAEEVRYQLHPPIKK